MTSIRLSGRKARLQGCSSPLAIVWTLTTPFTEAGVGERGAWACPGDDAHAVHEGDEQERILTSAATQLYGGS